MKGMLLKGSDGPDPPQHGDLSEFAAVAVGRSERGIGIQLGILTGKGSIDGAVVYMNEPEAEGVIAKLRAAIESRVVTEDDVVEQAETPGNAQ